MKKYQIFLSENFHILEVKFSVCLNRHVFEMVLSLFVPHLFVFCWLGIRDSCISWISSITFLKYHGYSFEDNLHGMTAPVYWDEQKKVQSQCAEMLTTMLSVIILNCRST